MLLLDAVVVVVVVVVDGVVGDGGTATVQFNPIWVLCLTKVKIGAVIGSNR